MINWLQVYCAELFCAVINFVPKLFSKKSFSSNSIFLRSNLMLMNMWNSNNLKKKKMYLISHFAKVLDEVLETIFVPRNVSKGGGLDEESNSSRLRDCLCVLQEQRRLFLNLFNSHCPLCVACLFELLINAEEKCTSPQWTNRNRREQGPGLSEREMMGRDL